MDKMQNHGAMRIFFIDYGNSEVRTAEFLRPFRDEFINPAPQAVKCALAGIDTLYFCSLLKYLCVHTGRF